MPRIPRSFTPSGMAVPYFTPATRVLQLRIPGVLRRIGGAYAIAALLGVGATPRRQAGLVAALLVGDWLTLRLYPLAPPPETLTARVDRFFLAGHLGGTSRDRMGILPTFPAAAAVLLGMLCGRWLETPNRPP